MKLKLMKSKYAKIFVIIFCILLLLFMLPFFVPMTTHLVVGNKIINNHIEKMYSKESNLQQNLEESFRWLNNSYIPYGEDRIFPLYGINNGFYIVNNKTILFIRPTFVSWFILTKTGNCCEHADYFTEIFNRLGYDVRKVYAAGGDHSIVQIVSNNKSYFIDPSSKTIINDTNYFENGQWGRVIAIKTNGAELDLTDEVLVNKSSVLVVKNTTKHVKALLSSSYLMKRGGMYKKPIEVYAFKLDNGYDSIIISSGEDYVVEYFKDYFVYKFSTEQNISLTKNTTLYVNDVPVKYENFKFTLIGYVIILIFCFIALYFSINLVIKSVQRLFVK